ncbi:MAG: vWA domain-containing protein [bacterium]
MNVSKKLVVPLTLSMILVSCSNQEFAGSGQKLSGTSQSGGRGDSEDQGTKEKKFAIDPNRGLVDILWLIDTSDSVRKDKIAKVQQNFGRFLTNLTKSTRLSLVADESVIKLSPDALTAGHVQINKFVNSSDALVIAKGLLNGGSVPLRSGARLVLVVVTDDNAASVTDTNFLEGLVAQISSKKPVIFAFRGDVSKPNCLVEKGVAYENLARITGGRVFDVCDLDWSLNFDALVSSVESIANSAFKIDDLNFASVSRVILDGVMLEPRDYAVINGEVQLLPALISASSKELVVKYKLKDVSR